MAVVVAVVITAILTAALTMLVARRQARSAVNAEIGGRSGADPVDEHRRMLVAAKNNTAAATAQADLLTLALNALTSGVIVTDHAGKQLVRNKFASEMSERSHEQTLIDVTTAELLDTARRGTPCEREVEVFGPPSRILFVNAVPITGGNQIVGALAVVDDVTDHHRIDKTRRDFIANLSHELRTPVGAVSLLAEMLVQETDPETRTQLTERMLVETDRMTATIDDLLELSRIESDEQTYDEIVVVQGLLELAVERTRVQAETGQISVGVVAPQDPITMQGNRSQLATALVNLVENAIKYSSPGDSVSLRARSEGEMVALVVQDTGRGIPARDIDRIFERFYRVDRSRDASTGGTGIGLSIVRHVALNHAGTVEVESYEGDGSTFTMLLPTHGPEATDSLVVLEAEPPQAQSDTEPIAREKS